MILARPDGLLRGLRPLALRVALRAINPAPAPVVEPPTTWFEVWYTEARILVQNQNLVHIELCHDFPR